MRLSIIVSLLFASMILSPAPGSAEIFPQGVASGDVSSTGAIVWTRTASPVELRLEWVALSEKDLQQADPDQALDKALQENWSQKEGVKSRTLATSSDHDQALQVVLGDLEPATTYAFRFLTSEASGSHAAGGTFRTAPPADHREAVHFLVGGDLGGQTFCRHIERGYAIFQAMAREQADFFIANGDMIYADNPCPPRGIGDWQNLPGDFPGIADIDWTAPGAARENLLAHWRYNRADPHHRRFLSTTPMYVQWDDHEVINDFGLAWPEWPLAPERAGWRTLVEAGIDALHLFNPMTSPADEPRRVYRSFRWGRDVEVFLLDARSYRSANDLPDRPSSAKAMLGAEQVAWLERGLTTSNATWKIVSSDVPLSIPTGSNAHLYGRDGFANGLQKDFSERTGSERELLGLLTALDAANVRNVVFVVTDVHLAANLRYAPDLDGDGDRLLFHELINGPLNAISLPTAPQLDPTLSPTVLYTEGGFFNYSDIRIEGPRLEATIRDQEGQVRPGSRLELTAE